LSTFSLFPDYDTTQDPELAQLEKMTVQEAFAQDLAKTRLDAKKAASLVYAGK
jgi:hypothetical protein